MGLDVTAYSKIALDPNAEVDGDGYPVKWDAYFMAHPGILAMTEKDWPGRTGGLKPGVYAYGDVFDFRAGSYGGYNSWRNELAELAGYGSASNVWEMDSPEGPFVELINFSDCEGIIAGDVAKKLAKDFAEFQEKVGEHGYFSQSYTNWRKAFELAADGGAVDFH